MSFSLQDIQALREMMVETVKGTFPTLLHEHLTLFPTKEEYFARMDKISGELQTIRQEQEIYIHKMLKLDTDMKELQQVCLPKKRKSKTR